MKRYRWLIGIGIVLVIIVVGVSYMVYSASTVDSPHTPTGVATACGTAIPSTGLRTFQIVPDQTMASYGGHDNLILRNLPSNNAIHTTHPMHAIFRLRPCPTPLVPRMHITF